uniref:BRICHOS domain-containing protein n=1 Tax=Steinernema glaseri TaxID=37863 RepID=A0A1I7YUY8_9BILA
MAEVMRLPQLSSEPKGPMAFPSKHSPSSGAPPSYRSVQSSLEEDTSSGLWSENSSALGKRRASWTNLVESDQNLKRYEPHVYPKVAGSLSSLPSSQRVCVFPAASSISSRMSEMSHQLKPNYAQPPVQFGYAASIADTGSVSHSSGPYPLGRSVAYAPSQQSVVSGFIHVPHGNFKKLNEAHPPPSQGSEGPKRDRMESIRQFCAKPRNKLLLLFLFFLIIAAIVVAIVLSQTLVPAKHFDFLWLAPDSLRQNEQTPNKVTMDVDGDQVNVNLVGAMPFQGSYRSVLDFKTNRVVIMDSSLKRDGNYSTCFVMNLDRNNLPDVATLQKAARAAEDVTKQKQGWAEAWNFTPQPLSDVRPETFLNPPVKECDKARWIQLNYVGGDQKNSKCTNCFEFCLPEYGIEKDFSSDTHVFNIVRRNCFKMFVPEWRNFVPDYSQPQNQGPNGFGNFNGTLNQVQQPGQELQSKWISLQTVPQTIANGSQQLYGSVQNPLAGGPQNFQNQQQGQTSFAFSGNQQQASVGGSNNFQQNGQAAGPPYSGQVAVPNGQFSPQMGFGQTVTSEPQQMASQDQFFASQSFVQQNSPLQQQPSAFGNSQNPINPQQPSQGQQYHSGEAGRMNGVNGQSPYQNQARYGGPTNYQPQSLFHNQEAQQNGPSSPLQTREAQRFHAYNPATPPQPHWINVG